MTIKDKTLEPIEETLGSRKFYPYDAEKLIDELWLIMFSDGPHNEESRNKLVSIYKKLKFYSKKGNYKKIKNKESKRDDKLSK